MAGKLISKILRHRLFVSLFYLLEDLFRVELSWKLLNPAKISCYFPKGTSKDLLCAEKLLQNNSPPVDFDEGCLCYTKSRLF